MSALDHTGYGLCNGVLKFISDVPSGLACRCVCARCGKALVAKKGPIRQPHFAHYIATDCHGAAESSLHLLAKELLAELSAFEVPQFRFSKERRTKRGVLVRFEKIVAKGGTVSIDRVRIEEQQGDFIPDIVIETGSRALLIEVAVTHKVDRAKLRKLRRRGLPAIEIRLDPSDSFLPRDVLKQRLGALSPAKVWLFHPAQRPAERSFATVFRREVVNARRAPTFASNYPRPCLRPIPARPVDEQPHWTEYNRAGEEFNRKHGRYPSLQELREQWPHLFRKRRP